MKPFKTYLCAGVLAFSIGSAELRAGDGQNPGVGCAFVGLSLPVLGCLGFLFMSSCQALRENHDTVVRSAIDEIGARGAKPSEEISQYISANLKQINKGIWFDTLPPEDVEAVFERSGLKGMRIKAGLNSLETQKLFARSLELWLADSAKNRGVTRFHTRGEFLYRTGPFHVLYFDRGLGTGLITPDLRMLFAGHTSNHPGNTYDKQMNKSQKEVADIYSALIEEIKNGYLERP